MKITLKAARVNAGLSQKKVVETLGISNKTLFNWEHGITIPNIDNVNKLCNLYGLECDNIKWNS